MNLEAALTLTAELMAKHDLIAAGWRPIIGSGRKTLGVCRYKTKTISISRHLIAAVEPAEVEQVILHEIAHALAGYDAAHGPLWKLKALEIGVTNPAASAEHATHMKVSAVDGFDTAVAAAQRPWADIRPGYRVRTYNGKTGTVESILQVNYVVKLDGDPRLWRFRFGSIMADVTLPPAAQQAEAAPEKARVQYVNVLATPGQDVRITQQAQKKYLGMVGKVQAVNKTRYRVDFGANLVLTVPFGSCEVV